MSSPLEGRIERIAREVIQRVLPGAVAGSEESAADSVAEQLRGLHEELHALATRVTKLTERIERLEGTPAPARRTRKNTAADA